MQPLRISRVVHTSEQSSKCLNFSSVVNYSYGWTMGKEAKLALGGINHNNLETVGGGSSKIFSPIF